MASSYTGLGTELMTTGENAGTWGTTTNTNLQIIEQISGGYTEQDIAGSADTTTLSVSDGSTGAVLGHRVIKFTGTITGNQIVTIPLDVQQLYVLVNGTSGAYTVQFKYASGSGSSVTFAATDKGTKLVYAAADHASNPNLVDSGIGSTAGHDLDGNELILDADADTSITADTDDQIDIRIAGADDFQFTANTFTAQAGSTIAAQALTATTVTASGIVKTDDTTEATTTTDGSLQTDGGLSVAKDAVFGDDVKLLSDSAVLSFGADSDTTLTHTDGTGLTLNSTNKLLFRDTGLYINSSTDGQLDLVADTEIQIAATTIDINGAIAMDGAITGATNITLSGELDAATLDISGNADIDGTANLDAVDIDGAVQIDSTVTVGVDDTGHDVKFFGATSGSYMLWDESTDDLVLAGAAKLYLYDAAGGEYLSSSGSALTIASGGTAWELPTSDGSANQLLKTDGSGNLDWTTVSGTITALNNQAANRLTTIGSTTTELDGEANLSFTGSALTCIGTVTVGVDDTGHDVKFFGATSGAYMLWDESTDDLVLAGAAKLYLYDAAGGEHISSDGTDLTLAAGADLNLTATTDINVPSGVGMTFGDDGEKIEGDGTDLTISGNNINLTATADVVIPANVGITFGSGEKIEGDSTDLTITSGAKINLTATSDVVIPANVGITFGSGEKIEGDSTDLTITSGAKINLTATSDVVIPTNVGLHFTDSSEKIESDGTDLTINAGADINLTATTDINVPANVGITFGDDGEKIEGDGTDLTISASALATIDAGTDITLDADGGDIFVKDGGTTFGSLTNTSGNLIIKSGTTTALTFSGANATFAGTLATAAGGFNIAGLDIDGATDIGADIVDADLFIVDDGAGGTNRKVAASRIKTYIGGGTQWQAVKTGDYTASAGQGVFVNTTSAAITITLPAGTIGDQVSIVDYAGTFDTYNCTVAADGSEKIHGSTDDLTVATERAAFTLVFTDSTQGWLLTNN